MKIRTCPICDKPMKSAHYCQNCKTWIKNPYERDVTYYLNERHPASETNCEYHSSDKSGETVHSEAKPAATRSAAKSTATQPVYKQAVAGNTKRMTAGNTTGKRNTGGFRFTYVVLVIYIISAIAASKLGIKLTELPEYISENVFGNNKNYDDIGYQFETESESADVDYDEAMAEGKPCTGYNHFNVSGEEILDKIKDDITNNGYKIADSYTDVAMDRYNYTYYNHTEILYIQNEENEKDDTIQQIEVDWDEVTRQLHYIYLQMDDSEQLLAAATDFINIMASDYGLEAEKESWEELSDQIHSFDKEEELKEWNTEAYYIQYYLSSDGSCEIMIESNIPDEETETQSL